ncbi:hypothetical protein EV182_006769, partial [Spiromyces aspiralis]
MARKQSCRRKNVKGEISTLQKLNRGNAATAAGPSKVSKRKGGSNSRVYRTLQDLMVRDINSKTKDEKTAMEIRGIPSQPPDISKKGLEEQRLQQQRRLREQRDKAQGEWQREQDQYMVALDKLTALMQK